MKILHVCAELFPLLKTGGLADVVGALPKAQVLADSTAEVRILLPGFPNILQGINDQVKVTELDTFAGHITLLFGNFQGIHVYIIDAPHLYNRQGSPYHDEFMNDYTDNYKRFALLGWIACELACGLDSFWRAEVVHAHDWHAGLACAYLSARGKPALSVFTIHNMAYPGLFNSKHLSEIQIPADFYQMRGLEFYGQISYLKAGIFYADHVTTVSPTYATEITFPESGFGMHALLQERRSHGQLTGILNGVDETIWHPRLDHIITANYHMGNMKGKALNKTYLQTRMHLPVTAKSPLFAVISRLTEQKGLDWVLSALPSIVEKGGQLVVLGSGDIWMQDAFKHAAQQYPKHIAVHIGYDDALSHHIIAGSDVVLMPSRFEPCGLTQLYGLKYGTLPLVRSTGGLADTVIDCTLENLNDKIATGFVFHGFDTQALDNALRRVFALWSHPKDWACVQNAAMRQDYSWHNTANQYLTLYRNLF